MNPWLFAGLGLQLLVIAWIDLKTKKISNLWAIFNVLLAVGLWVSGINGPWNFQVLLFPVGFIVIGFMLFVLKIMGAGDSKFLASLMLCLPLSLHLVYFEKLLESTIVVGALLLIFKIAKDPLKFRAYLVTRHWQALMNMIKSHFSYAPVMLLAWLLMGVNLWL